MTKELVKEARAFASASPLGKPIAREMDKATRMVRRLADALEAATRVPVQGEPNDDREAVTGNELADAVHAYYEASGKPANSEGVRAVLLLSRPTVPDAATERVTENSVRHVKWLTTELQNKREALNDQRREYRALLSKRDRTIDGLRAERDAALAALARIRKAVSGHPECDRYEEGDVISCGWRSAYASVVAALDGAPEPEPEPEPEEEMYQARCGSWDCRAPECGRA